MLQSWYYENTCYEDSKNIWYEYFKFCILVEFCGQNWIMLTKWIVTCAIWAGTEGVTYF